MRREILFRPWRILALLLYAVVASGAAPEDSSSIARTREELFRAVFKRPPPSIPVDSYVVVVIDGTLRQKMRAVLAPDGHINFLEGKALTALLSRVLQPELMLRLQQRIDGRGFLDRAALEEAGLTVSFNTRTFEFLLATAPEMRAPRTLYLSPPPWCSKAPHSQR
jgi:hypothetical protein